MAEQHLLDLVRRDVLAAAADRVLHAVDEAERAVGLAHDAVAGVEPAGCATPRRVLLGACRSSRSRTRTARRRAARARRPRRAGSSASSSSTTRASKPGCSQPIVPRRGASGAARDDEVRLGRAVAFEQSRRRCARGTPPPRSPARRARGRCARGARARRRSPAARAASAPSRRAGRRRSRRRAASPARSPRPRSAARRRPRAPVSAACAKVLSALMWNSGSVVQSTSSAPTPRMRARVRAPPAVLRVRADHALRRAGRARRVEDRERSPGRDVGGVDRRRRRRARNAQRSGRRRGAASTRGTASPPTTPAPSSSARRASSCARSRARASPRCGLDDEQPRAAVGEQVADLRPHRRGVDRHRDRADPAAAEDDLEQLGAVAAHHRDAVAAADARRGAAPRRARRDARRSVGMAPLGARRCAANGRSPKRRRPGAASSAGSVRSAGARRRRSCERPQARRPRRCRRRGRSPARAGRRRARAEAPASAISPVSST